MSHFKIVNLSGHEEELCNNLLDNSKNLEKGRGNACCSGTGDKGVMFGKFDSVPHIQPYWERIMCMVAFSVLLIDDCDNQNINIHFRRIITKSSKTVQSTINYTIQCIQECKCPTSPCD